ncbi:MBL fold metallo-hydrolase [Patescibacteria group bacterium]|nr:MBL fold metallo-hydrolase [Patescibacteria group bacterium]
MLDITPLTVGQMATHCYVVTDPSTHECVIIDPGDDAEYISEMVSRQNAQPTMIVATHGHFDHIMAAFALQLAYKIPVAMHPEDIFLVDRMRSTAQHFLGLSEIDPEPSITVALENRSSVAVGREQLLVVHTPGHTPGSICLYGKKNNVLFCGDTIFDEGAIGSVDHAYSSRESIRKSINKILAYPEHTRLLPGHGEETTVGRASAFHVQ